MDHVIADVRFALRGLLRRPGVSLLTVATLAVGLAANAALFSVLDALLLRPLAFPEVDRMVRLWESSPNTESFDRSNASPANFLDWQAQAGAVFQRLVATEWWDANLLAPEAPERVQGSLVSPAFFELLGVRPPLGRAFLPEEGEAARRHAVVVGDDLWRRSFGADPGVLGRSLTINGEHYTVVGIAPAGFRFPEGTELWAPLALPAAAAPRDRHYLSVIGSLARGCSLEQARAHMELLANRLQQEHPASNASRGVVVQGLQRGYEDVGIRPVMAVWQASAAFLLLIACVNVANLTLARAAERRPELALRLALGARRGRIVRQLVTEGMVTALAAAALSLPLAGLAARQIRDHMPAEIARFVPGWHAIDVDGRTLLFSIALALLAALAFGAWPALRASRPDLAETLKDGGRTGSAGQRSQLGRNMLVVAEVASALALLVGAGLSVGTATRLLDGPQGFDPERLLTLQVTLPEARYGDAEARRGFARDALLRLAALPGVEHAALANILPARGSNSSRSVLLEGEAPRDRSDLPSADSRLVSAGYFETMGVPLLAGRALQESDREGALPVAVISRSMAQRFWPGQDPIGRRFRADASDAPLLTVVGVCGDVIHHWFARRNHPTFYRPYDQAPSADVAFALRTQGDSEGSTLSARKAIAAVDPQQPAYDVLSMRRALRRSTIGLQYGAAIMSVFGGLALVLAVSGVYGVMAYRVSLREVEFGVRLALGASRGDVLRLALGQASRLAALGIAAGLPLAFLLGRAMHVAFAGAVESDGVSFVGFSSLLATAAVLAAWLPVRRSLAADPTRLLRAQ